MDNPVATAGSAPPRPEARPARTGAVPALASGFVARPETVSGLAEALIPGAIVALAGGHAGPGRLGSCGKTQLAACLAGHLWRSAQVNLLAWVDASSRASVLSGYVEAAAAVGINPAGPAEDVAARFAGWMAETTRPWLVVLDDLHDAADLDGLWPGGPAGRVLVTTPDADAVAGQVRAQVVPVGPLSTREATNYLMSRLADDPDQRNGAIDLAITLGGDPCALTHAGAVIATTIQTCRDYQHRYTARQAQLAARQPGSPPPPAAITWVLSAERAEQLCPGGATWLLLALAAQFGGQPIPGSVFTTPASCTCLAQQGVPAAGPDRAWDAVHALERTGLLTVGQAATSPAVWISQVVAAGVRAALPGPVGDQAAQTAASALLEIWPRREPQPWLAAGLRSCAASLQRTAGDWLWAPDCCHPLLIAAGRSLDAARLTGPAVSHWTQLAATSDKILGPDSPASLTIGACLAQALLAAGQAPEAAACWQWAAAGRARISGPDHHDTLAARLMLGRALAAASRTGDSVRVLQETVADLERVRGPDHRDTLTARDELAAACQADGQLAEAIGHYQRTLASRERAHGPRHTETITARIKLGGACLAAGRLKQAIACYKKALADRRRVLGDGHLETITAQRNLAAACRTAGKIATALQLHEQACAGYDQALGADHPDTLAARADLANAYLAAGRLADAATLLRDTLTRCEQALPPGDPLTRTLRQSMTGLAAT
jgi:tetratricopeptide (TPR) repeat protein